MIWLKDEAQVQHYIDLGSAEVRRHGLFGLVVSEPYVVYHSLNVARYSLQIGIAKGLSDDNLLLLATGGICHDIGKSKVRKEILYKPDKLLPHEFAEIMKHTEYGYHILQKAHMAKIVCEIARDHHERLDGSGYTGFLRPSRLVQIVTVADIFSALTENRDYHEARTASEAISILKKEHGINKEYIELLVSNITDSKELYKHHKTYIPA